MGFNEAEREAIIELAHELGVAPIDVVNSIVASVMKDTLDKLGIDLAMGMGDD